MSTTIVPNHSIRSKIVKFEGSSFAVCSGIESVFSIAPKVHAQGILDVYENSIKYYHPDSTIPQTTPPERIENDIKSFSQKSRRHLFDIFNKINYSSYGVPLFLSLTWHYDSPTTRHSIKLFLKLFRQRLEKIFPPFHYVWKFEYQKRGTPHFHIMLLPLTHSDIFYSDEKEKEIKKHWNELKVCKCIHCKTYSAHVVKVSTYQMALSYIAKEIAKVEENYLEHDLGRIWGTSQKLNCEKKESLKITLDEYELFINRAVKLIEERLIKNSNPDDKHFKSLESSKNYLLGLKFIPNNSTVFIPQKEILDLIMQFKNRNKIINKSNKLILNKFIWR